MNTQFTGKHKKFFQQTDSTITQAWNLLSQHPPEGTLIFTDHQYQGKGQRGNNWLSEPNVNIALSIIYYPTFVKGTELYYLNKFVSLAVQQTISHYLPRSTVQIKWPNDILVQKKKISGILIENQFEGPLLKSSIIGIGINVNQTSFPAEIDYKTTSLKRHLHCTRNKEEVMERLLEQLEFYYLSLKEGKTDMIDQAYHKALYGYQQEIMLTIDQEEKKVVIEGVDVEGRLLVRIGSAIFRYFHKEVGFIL